MSIIKQKYKNIIQFTLLFLMFFFSFWHVYCEPGILSVLLCSFVAFIWFLLAVKKRLLFYFFFFLFFIPCCIHFVYQLVFHQAIDYHSIEQIFLSNTAIIWSFLKSHPLFFWCIPAAIIFFILFLGMVASLMRKHKSSNQTIAVLSAIMFILFLIFHVFVLNTTIFQVIWNGYDLWKQDRAFLHDIMKKKINTSFFNIKNSEDQTIILVVGDSETKGMMSLYGYEKNTTPFLSERKDSLMIFSDVFSPHANTAKVLDKALTLKTFSNETPNNFGSVVDLFSQAGFNVWWLSSPPLRDVWSGSILAVIASAAEHKFFLNKGALWDKHDIDLLPQIKKAILHPSSKKLIVIHLLGSHQPYEDRYSEKDHRSDLTLYENTIYATDYFMNKVLSFLEKENVKNTKLLYLSDHGESMKCNCHSDALGYPEMFEVPFYLWLSPDIRGNFKYDKEILQKPYNTENLIHSIADLANVSADEIDYEKSIFNKNRKAQYIILEGKKYAISSDLIFDITQPTIRGKVMNFSSDYLKIKWYSSGVTEKWKNTKGLWKKE